jgi:hypothetical protein
MLPMFTILRVRAREAAGRNAAIAAVLRVRGIADARQLDDVDVKISRLVQNRIAAAWHSSAPVGQWI